MKTATKSHTRVWQAALFVLVMTFNIVSITTASAAPNATPAKKSGLPIISLEVAGASEFQAARTANPGLYGNVSQYHAFYDSRAGKVVFQNAEGAIVTPVASARNFVAVWHDGVSTDWRYVDADLAARVPATDRADQLAHIAWAVKALTQSPRVLVVGNDANMKVAHLYMKGEAVSQFNGAKLLYNNDFHGLLTTNLAKSAATSQTSAIAKFSMLNSAAEELTGKEALAVRSAVKLVNGINESNTVLAPGKSKTFTSKMGAVVWSVMEGPQAGIISPSGLLVSGNTSGKFHVVAISTVDHSTVAVTPFAVVTPPSVTTNRATLVTSQTATLSATINPNGATGFSGFLYGTSPTFSGSYSGTSLVPISGSTNTAASAAVTKLNPNTTYYVRAFFQDGTTNTRTFGATVPFITTGAFANTLTAINITSSSLTLRAQVAPGDIAGFAYFVYSKDNFVHSFSTTHVPYSAGDNTVHTLTAPLTGVTSNTAYKFKVVLDQTAGNGKTIVGSIVSSSTIGFFIEDAKVNFATSIGQHGAQLNGKYGTGGSAAFIYVQITKDSTFATGVAAIGQTTIPAGNFAYVNVTTTPTTLTRNTTYFFRYVIRNNGNNQQMIASFPRSFTTLP